MSLDEGNGRYDYSLIVTWEEKNITSGVLSQSNDNNGDHVYRFYLHIGDVMRNRYHTITGESHVNSLKVLPPFS